MTHVKRFGELLVIFSTMIAPLPGRSTSCLAYGQGPERYGRKRLGCPALRGILGKRNVPVVGKKARASASQGGFRSYVQALFRISYRVPFSHECFSFRTQELHSLYDRYPRL